MSNQILEIKNKIISEYTFYHNEESILPQWQMDELDKTDQRIEKELRENGFIKTYSVEESDKRIRTYIDNLYS